MQTRLALGNKRHMLANYKTKIIPFPFTILCLCMFFFKFILRGATGHIKVTESLYKRPIELCTLKWRIRFLRLLRKNGLDARFSCYLTSRNRKFTSPVPPLKNTLLFCCKSRLFLIHVERCAFKRHLNPMRLTRKRSPVQGACLFLEKKRLTRIFTLNIISRDFCHQLHTSRG